MNILPNFYLSEPYLEIIGAECFERDGWIWIEEGEWILFPPLPINGSPQNLPEKNIWSDFGYYPWDGYKRRFLDFEYSFNPMSFNDMAGGRWQVYRKNSRKWKRDHVNWEYIDKFKKEEDVFQIIAQWLESKRKEVQDGEVLASFAHFSESPSVSRKYLYEGEKLKAINAWDENYARINYRVCMTTEEPWLQEFSRLLFYTDPLIQIKNKLVNDGGSLDNKGLERFKDKMNPVEKRKVYSWIKKT